MAGLYDRTGHRTFIKTDLRNGAKAKMRPFVDALSATKLLFFIYSHPTYTMHSGRKLHAILTDCKNIQAGILKKVSSLETEV